MVIAEVRFKVVAHKPRSQPKVCSTKLRDEVTREAFCAEVRRYLDESDIVEGVEQSWASFRTALNAAATKLLIPEKRAHKPWITVETLALIRKRAELQLRKHSSAEALLVFSNCCKEVRKALRSDKRQWLKDKGETIQDHSDKGDLKEVFWGVKTVMPEVESSYKQNSFNHRRASENKRRRVGTLDRAL